MRRLRILKRPRNSASRHRQRRSEREKDQEDSDDRHGKPQLASRDRRGTRRRRDDGGFLSRAARERFTADGLLHEIISWKLRMFVPTDASGPTILAKLMDRYPVVRVGEREAA